MQTEIHIKDWDNMSEETKQAVMKMAAKVASLDKEKMQELMKIQCAKLEGYAGVLPNGNVVDRREHPEAIPLQKNSLLHIPEPRPLPAVYRSEWPDDPNCDTCGTCGGSITRPLPKHADPCNCAGRPNDEVSHGSAAKNL